MLRKKKLKHAYLIFPFTYRSFRRKKKLRCPKKEKEREIKNRKEVNAHFLYWNTKVLHSFSVSVYS